MQTAYNPAASIKEMFKQIDKVNNLTHKANSLHQDCQHVNITYTLAFCSTVLNNTCSAWKHIPNLAQTWA
eukprot:2754465-Ditylum_brightwellii.AAC.1